MDRSQEESTKFGGSPRPYLDAINSEIEKKFSKKKNKRCFVHKAYLEDENEFNHKRPD